MFSSYSDSVVLIIPTYKSAESSVGLKRVEHIKKALYSLPMLYSLPLIVTVRNRITIVLSLQNSNC